MEQTLTRLEALSNKLKRLATIESDMSHLLGTQHVGYELQYDVFMDFVGLYEDAKKEASLLPELERRRVEKKLEALWGEHETN